MTRNSVRGVYPFQRKRNLGYDEILINVDRNTLRKGRWTARTIYTLGFLLLGFCVTWMIVKAQEQLQQTVLGDSSWKYFLDFLEITPQAAWSLAGVSLVVLSLGLLAKQIQENRETSLQGDLPVVLISPKLMWARPWLDSDGRIKAQSLSMEFVLHNVGNSPGVRFQLHVSTIEMSGDGKNWTSILSDVERFSIDGIPSHSEMSSAVSGDVMKIDLTAKCLGLLESILLNRDDNRLRVYLDVQFWSIRRLSFRESAEVLWSAEACRRVCDNSQLEFLTNSRDVLASELDLTRMSNLAKRHPLSGIVTIKKR